MKVKAYLYALLVDIFDDFSLVICYYSCLTQMGQGWEPFLYLTTIIIIFSVYYLQYHLHAGQSQCLYQRHH